MTSILRQSTAIVRTFGPFVDKTDGVTFEIALVSALDHASTGIMLSKNGGGLTIRHAAVTPTTYDALGNYLITLDTTDTNTVGALRVQYGDPATCLSVWRDFQVVEEAVYDALFAASAPGYVANAPVNIAQWSGTNVAAPDTAGYPKVTLKSGAGTGEVSLIAGAVNAAASVWNALRASYVIVDSFGKMSTDSEVAIAVRIEMDNNSTKLLSIETTQSNVLLDTQAILDDTGTNGVVIAASNRPGIRKSTALLAFKILMTDSTTHNPAPGLPVTVTRQIDDEPSFSVGTLGAVVEVGNGLYKFDIGAEDLNGAVVTLRATAPGADNLVITIKTSP